MKALLLILFLSASAFAQEKSDSLMKGTWGLGQLLQWELVRLESLGETAKLPFADDSDLKKKILDKPEVTLKDLFKFLSTTPKPSLNEEEKHELLGVLRLANTIGRIDTDDREDTYRTLIVNELKKIDPSKNLVLKLPRDVEDRVIKEAKEKLDLTLEAEKITSTDLQKVLESARFKKGLIKEKELASLLGKVREESAKERGQEFISDVAEDRLLDKLFVEVGKRSPSGRLTKDKVFQTLFPKPNALGDIEPPRINVQKPKNLKPEDKAFHSPTQDLPPVDRGKLRSGPPSSSVGPPSDPGLSEIDLGQGDRGLLLDRRTLGNGVGEIQNRKLLERQNAGKFSLIMRMSFQGAGSSRCQTTIVKKESVGDRCTYDAATARHCVVNEERPSAQLSALSIQGIGSLDNAEISVDPNGNDFALIKFTAACAEVPVVPLRQERVSDGDEILVETVPGGTMVGRARDAVSGDSLMALDVRSPLNQPFGINPGDSGGGIATVGPGGNLELVGVISSKPVDQRLAGIGFFAAKSSMDWANELLSQPRVARSTQPGASPSTH